VVVAEVIVLEKQARWAPELQRQFLDQTVAVRACRDVTSMRERVAAAQSSEKDCVAVLDPVGWPGECLPVISWLRSLKIHVAVVGYPGIELLEPSLRELGVTNLVLPPIAGHELGDACRRLLSQLSVQSRGKGSR
jgi:hypothetical protein